MDFMPAIAALRGAAASSSADGLHLPLWREEDWERLLAATTPRDVSVGEAVIRRGAQDRTFYLLLRGEVEVMAHSDDAVGFGRIARLGPGTVVGEQAFFAGEPRSAGAWAITECELAAMTPDGFDAFRKAAPQLACDLLFALGRVLALRLHRTTARVFG